MIKMVSQPREFGKLRAMRHSSLFVLALFASARPAQTTAFVGGRVIDGTAA
jgi:hypothetical protein